MEQSIETDRLTLRRWTADDGPAVLALYGNAEVARWLHRKPMTPSETEEAMAVLLSRQALFEFPYGLWAIVEQSSGLVAGMGLIKPRPGVGEQPVEVGWHLNRDFWGKGYATEMACGLITAHFEHSDADEVTTIILPDNLRSQATAARLGFVHSGEWFLHPVGLNHRSYRLKREDWPTSSE